MKLKEFLTQKINKDTLKKDSVKRAIKITVCCAFILSLIFQLVCCSFGPLVIHAYSNPLAEDVQLVYVDELPTTEIDDNAIYVVTTSSVDENSFVGTWVFNDDIDVNTPISTNSGGNGQNNYWFISTGFVSNGVTYSAFYFDYFSLSKLYRMGYYDGSDNTLVYEDASGVTTWETNGNIITFTSDFVVSRSGVDYTDIFHEWLLTNAVKQGGSGSSSSVTTYYVHYNNTWFETDNISTAVSFINYRVTNPSSVNTLPELLESYTGSFDSLVDMLNTNNYNEYESYLNEVEDSAFNRGASASFGENMLGSAFNAPLNALHQWVLFETPGGIEVTMGALFTAVIALAVLVIFLKMFAGG